MSERSGDWQRLVEVATTCLTSVSYASDNDGMNNPDGTPKPFQFGLRSIFLVTSAIAVTLGVLKWRLGPLGFAGLVIATVQCAAVIAVLAKSKGTAWPGFIVPGLSVPFVIVAYGARASVVALFFASLAAWFGGGLTASEATRERSWFLEWSWLLSLIWFLLVLVALIAICLLTAFVG
jgi:hypothetical protein